MITYAQCKGSACVSYRRSRNDYVADSTPPRRKHVHLRPGEGSAQPCPICQSREQTLLFMSCQFRTRFPHREQQRRRPKRRRLAIIRLPHHTHQPPPLSPEKGTDLDEGGIHLTAHTLPDPSRRMIVLPRPPLGLARAPGVARVEKVLLEERVVEECLEDGGEETCLREVEERADGWAGVRGL
jgi:hypothetical protein